MALDLKKTGKDVTVIDLDIVNPYYRTADFSKLFEENNIQLIAPLFANTNLDMPSLTGNIDSMLYDKDPNHYFIVDVGGDEAGAVALGRYSKALLQLDHDMYYVINCYRYLTQNSSEATELLTEIESYSKLKATKLINNSNLGEITTKEDVAKSSEFAKQIAKLTALPLAFTTVNDEVADISKQDKYDKVKLYVTTKI